MSASEVVVVVNGASFNSRTLANHYVHLRQIPPCNVIVLEDIPDSEKIPVSAFREKILKPLLQEIDTRKLSGHIQCIAYSTDFPTAIDISEDLASIKDLNLVFTKVASINGLTFLYDFVLRADPSYVTPEANFYARRPMGTFLTNPGGGQMADAWSEINLLVNDKEFAKASLAVDELIKKAPNQFPLRYLSAAYAAQAGQKEKALKRLDEAVASGWTSGGYLTNDPQFESLKDNEQFQSLLELLDSDAGKWQPTVGFKSRSMWAANGVEFQPNNQSANSGMRYMLCTVLGVTRGLGTTMQQAIESLERSTQADFSHPNGGFYFASTLDVRSKTRRPNFDYTVEELRKLGYSAEIITQEVPKNQKVVGAQLGSPFIDWGQSQSQLLLGAIVDNLTSFGGIMTPPKTQTSLTHFISSGASGSSGTVTEPYSVQFKFPLPQLYLHYAQGLTLAESFYQSVTGPYQLLIVGDPLCQPFSIAPNQPLDKSLKVIRPGGTIKISPDLTGPNFAEWSKLNEPPAQRRKQLRAGKFAVQIDGRTATAGNIQPDIKIKLDKQSLGYHEIQVILLADDPLQQRSMQTIPVWIGPTNLVELALDSIHKNQSQFPADRLISIVVNHSDQATEITLMHESEVITTSPANSTSTQLQVTPKQLGAGPVRVQAKVQLKDDSTVASQFLWLDIES